MYRPGCRPSTSSSESANEGSAVRSATRSSTVPHATLSDSSSSAGLRPSGRRPTERAKSFHSRVASLTSVSASSVLSAGHADRESTTCGVRVVPHDRANSDRYSRIESAWRFRKAGPVLGGALVAVAEALEDEPVAELAARRIVDQVEVPW